jgi:hypothetical protein
MGTLDVPSSDLVRTEMQRVLRSGENSETLRCGFFGIAAVRDVEALLARRAASRPLALKRAL